MQFAPAIRAWRIQSVLSIVGNKRNRLSPRSFFLFFVGHFIESTFIIGTEKGGVRLLRKERKREEEKLPFTGRAGL